MVQEIASRASINDTNSYTGWSSRNQAEAERPHSSSSEIELTGKCAAATGITKTVAWETSNSSHQDTSSRISEQDGHSPVSFQPANVVSTRNDIVHF